ncbi:MAG: DUF3830 family protein [Acidimicrobiales bacterium]
MSESREISLRVGDVVARARLDNEVSPHATEIFWSALPIRARLSHAKWSGHAAFFMLQGDSLHGIELETPVCSIYPGTIVARPGGSEVLMAYGPSEYRTATGTDYVTRIAHVVEGIAEFRATLAGMHDGGDIDLVIERA